MLNDETTFLTKRMHRWKLPRPDDSILPEPSIKKARSTLFRQTKMVMENENEYEYGIISSLNFPTKRGIRRGHHYNKSMKMKIATS